MEGVPAYPVEDVKKYRSLHLWWDMTIGEAFDRIAMIYHDKVAVVDDVRQMTYGEMKELINRLSPGLIELGLQPGQVVLLQMPNVVEFCIIYQALQNIGVIPVMAVPRHAEKEMEHFGRITDAVAWIGPAGYRKIDYMPMVGSLRESLSSLKHVIIVDEVGESEKPGSLSYQKILKEFRARQGRYIGLDRYRPDPNEVCHLMPTGGTTGLPKLVPRTHNNYLCNSYFSGTASEKGPKDADLIVTPIAHNAGLQRWVIRLVFGGKLVLGNSTRPVDILNKIQKDRATTCFLVPTLIIDLLNEPEFSKYDLSSLFSLSGGGAYMPPELLREIKRRIGCHAFNVFGMAEGPCIGPRPDFTEEEIFHTIGRPHCPYDEYKILDDKEQEVSPGQEGELAGKGPIVFTGYYKAEESNRKAFTHDGFFRTGDLARINIRGNYIITGRSKDIINRGGEKISAEEVEEMIMTLEGVMEVAAVAMPDPRMGEKVCAYIKPRKGYSMDLDKVTAHLKSLGASVLLLPERVELIDELPLTPIGKIDKKILRELIAEKLAQENK